MASNRLVAQSRKGGGPGGSPSSREIHVPVNFFFFIFMQFLAKIMASNKLVAPSGGGGWHAPGNPGFASECSSESVIIRKNT